MESDKQTTPNPGQSRGFLWLALAAAVMTFILIVVGGIVRVTESGLGCPDWPLCYGRLIPPLEFTAIVEYTHRLAASLASPLILATAVVAWLRHRSARWIRNLATLSVGLLVVQILLGGVTVLMETPPTIVALHLGNALLILALQVAVAVLAFRLNAGASIRFSLGDRLARAAAATAVATFLLLVSGALVTSSGASGSCAGWPLCDGQLWPPTLLSQVHMLHRVVAGVTGLLILALGYTAWRHRTQRPVAFIAAATTAVLVLAQIGLGALNILWGFPQLINGLHVATASAVWAALVVTTTLAMLRPQPYFDAQNPNQEGQAPGLKDLIALTKPIIVALLLVTTLAAMVVAAKGWPGTSLVAWTLLGGALSAGGSSALNQYIDRYADRSMVRTAGRPIPRGSVHEAIVVAFGIVLCVIGFYTLAVFVNLLSALLALAGMVYYVVLYSIGLKQLTTHNIVIGGGAGAIPPLVGWAAVTGGLSVAAFLMFAVIFFWTPPHFWALALVRRKDYARAGVPMLPVVHGEKQTRREILLYTIQVVALTMLLPVAQLGGWFYIVAAALLGGGLVMFAWTLWRRGGNRNAWRMYRYSSLYLALIFGALVLDTFI